jgi:hypothetical protein
VHAVFLHLDGLVRMPAENALRTMMMRVGQSPAGDLGRHAQPARIQPVDQPRDRLAFEVEFLQQQVQRRPQLAEPEPVHLKAIKLVPVDGHVPQSLILPEVVLINPHAHQVRHDVGQAVIVVALDPHDFDITLGVRELADIAEKLPVFLGQPGKVEIGEDVAKKNQSPEAVLLEHASGFARVAGLCTQVQVREDQRVVHVQIHTIVLAADCYAQMNAASILVQLR